MNDHGRSLTFLIQGKLVITNFFHTANSSSYHVTLWPSSHGVLKVVERQGERSMIASNTVASHRTRQNAAEHAQNTDKSDVRAPYGRHSSTVRSPTTPQERLGSAERSQCERCVCVWRMHVAPTALQWRSL